MNEYTFDRCIIDADSLIYKVAYTEKIVTKCKNNFDKMINGITKACDAAETYVFIKGDHNFRMSYEPTYKSNRKDTIEPDVKERVKEIYEHAKEYCIESDGGEADDYVTATAKQCRDQGLSYIVAHIDKDLNCIPGWHYNFSTCLSIKLFPAESYQFMMQQLLTGDATDAIQGLRNVGPVKAGKYLENKPPENMIEAVYDMWKQKHPEDWKERFTVCANLIYMRESFDDIRPLTFEELNERFTWKITDTGLHLPTDHPGPSDSFTLSSAPQVDSTSEESN